MRKLLNIVYISTPDIYLALDGENIILRREEKTISRFPLHNIEQVICFSYNGVSPALMGACAEKGIGLCFLSPYGKFLARVEGKEKGNVLLRKKQYRLSDDPKESAKIAIPFLLGKVGNCRKVIDRAIRDHSLLVDVPLLRSVSSSLKESLTQIKDSSSLEELMGFEGSAAKLYFDQFDQLILKQKEDFYFRDRNRRPPLDNMNALLSFLYTLLTSDVTSALETVGLDPYVGFLHRDRPGRPSLALDLMEELRPVFADRLALSMVNLKQVTGTGFVKKESGGILMDTETRKKVLTLWQERKKETILHPFLKEKIEFGLIPYVQALLLARYLRGDLDAYPPFFWS
ncbi:MAG: type I-C CRISPR-associated endonuclease Cas1 [Leptolinea sp.]|nr:type I-C CRISPR-associated endonuclease Cas1 [Leptolinea sp.]